VWWARSGPPPTVCEHPASSTRMATSAAIRMKVRLAAVQRIWSLRAPRARGVR
jgi:hypothetical protein